MQLLLVLIQIALALLLWGFIWFVAPPVAWAVLAGVIIGAPLQIWWELRRLRRQSNASGSPLPPQPAP